MFMNVALLIRTLVTSDLDSSIEHEKSGVWQIFFLLNTRDNEIFVLRVATDRPHPGSTDFRFNLGCDTLWVYWACLKVPKTMKPLFSFFLIFT